MSTIEQEELLFLYSSILNDKKALLILFNRIINAYFISDRIPIERAKKDLSLIFNNSNRNSFRCSFEIHCIQRCNSIENDWKWDIYIRVFASNEFSDIYWDDLPCVECRMIVERLITNSSGSSRFNLIIPNNMPIEKTIHYLAFDQNEYLNSRVKSLLIDISKKFKENLLLLKLSKENKRIEELCRSFF